MEPQQDQRNLILFIVIAVLFLFAYQTFIIEPDTQRRQAAAEKAKVEREQGEEIAPTVEIAATVDEALARSSRIVFDLSLIHI